MRQKLSEADVHVTLETWIREQGLEKARKILKQAQHLLSRHKAYHVADLVGQAINTLDSKREGTGNVAPPQDGPGRLSRLGGYRG
jgi:hypothetical protein